MQMKRFLSAYYWTFEPTGVDEIDAILEAIATAGKMFHNTSEWDEPVVDEDGPCYWDVIQMRANVAAARLKGD